MRAAWFFPIYLVSAGAAHAHVPELHPGDAARLGWAADPWAIVSLGAAAALYLHGARRLFRHVRGGAAVQRRSAVLFASGWLVAALALVSPIDALGGDLFSAHMVQHELLMLIAAPLLVSGEPGAAFAWSLPPTFRRSVGSGLRGVRRLWRALTQAPVAWLLHALVLWTWHVPSLFQAALQSDAIHTLQHLSFFLAAIVFWRSLLTGASGYGMAVLSLFTTAVHSSLLGALLTFASAAWYPFYEDTTVQWGLSPLEDQQLGGLIMWVPGGVAYLIAGIWLLVRGLGLSEVRARQRDDRTMANSFTKSDL